MEDQERPNAEEDKQASPAQEPASTELSEENLQKVAGGLERHTVTKYPIEPS